MSSSEEQSNSEAEKNNELNTTIPNDGHMSQLINFYKNQQNQNDFKEYFMQQLDKLKAKINEPQSN